MVAARRLLFLARPGVAFFAMLYIFPFFLKLSANTGQYIR